jgi:hypothetical protein
MKAGVLLSVSLKDVENVFNTGARCVRKKKKYTYNTTRRGTHLLAFF